MINVVQTKEQAFERIQAHQSALRQFGAARLGLFGSFVRGEQTEQSDIDFIVEFEAGKKTFRNFINMVYYLEKVMGRKVELLTWEGMASFVRREAEKEIEYAPLTDFLRHIQEELTFLVQQSANVSYEEFINHPLLTKACIRSFEIIGEACKNIPDDLRYRHLEFDWKGFAGMRDKLIHNYWGIDTELRWDAIQTEVPINREWIDIIIEQEETKL